MSGLLPVDPLDESTQWWSDNSKHPRPIDAKVHRLIGGRRQASKNDRLGKSLINEITEVLRSHGVELGAKEFSFFRNVSIKGTEANYADSWDQDDLQEAVAGAAALGNRNRWAIIAWLLIFGLLSLNEGKPSYEVLLVENIELRLWLAELTPRSDQLLALLEAKNRRGKR